MGSSHLMVAGKLGFPHKAPLPSNISKELQVYDYSKQIKEFWDQKVRLGDTFKQKLFKHRQANRDRLIARLPDLIEGVQIGSSSFKPQGSMAMKTIIQTCFAEEEYDIDDGLVLLKSDLKDSDGSELSAMDVKRRIRDALKDPRFKRQPRLYTNCVRVFYAELDKEKHHVDIPVYRKIFLNETDSVRELASEDSWIVSDPTQVNRWFDDLVIERNQEQEGKGTQMRRLAHLLKRFCRSRKDWDLPNGMKLTMLVAECQPGYSTCLDRAFRSLLQALLDRLEDSKVIRNLAHPDQPEITRTTKDENVRQLHAKAKDALDELEMLDAEDCTQSDARRAWDWVFQSSGFFKDLDEREDQEESGGSEAAGSGLVSGTPERAVDHRGGGRFG